MRGGVFFTPPPAPDRVNSQILGLVGFFKNSRNTMGVVYLGKTVIAILDEFSENFQTASDPPPALVSENYVAFFSGGTKICNEIFRIGVTFFPKIHRYFP